MITTPTEALREMIHVRELTKTYADLRRGEFVALDRVSFDAREGEIYGLLGPNGAGKTTALRVLSTVLRPTHGSATVAGFDVVTQPSLVRHKIGFMSANTAVYDRMTAWEMVEYFGRLYGIDEVNLHARMEDLFERLQMEDIRDLLGAKMSTGMKQKVSVARAIVHDPPVLIFDEGHVGFGCVGGQGAAQYGCGAARSGKVHRLFDAYYARSRAVVRSDCDHASGADPG